METPEYLIVKKMKTSTMSRWEDAPDLAFLLFLRLLKTKLQRRARMFTDKLNWKEVRRNERPESCLFYRRRGGTSFNG